MKRIALYIGLALSVAACTDDFEELNIDQKNATEVPAVTLVSNAQKNLIDQLTTPSVNSGVFRLFAQQWAETTYITESQYDLTTRNQPQNFWYTMYRDVLRDLKEARVLINANEDLDAAVKANQLAQIEILEVYTWSILVNTYGDIPYSEALDFQNVYPAYEDDAAIYADLFNRLDAALAALNTGAVGLGSADLYYNGSVSSWKKFGNSLKLKMALTVADVNPEKAKAAAEAAADNVFTSNEDNADFQYLGANPNTNPVYTNLVESGRNDFVPANTLVNVMNDLNDPRRSPYFTQVEGKGYVGGVYGESNNYSAYSHVEPALTIPTFEALLLSYYEVEFYLAEAAARGYNVKGTAAEHYNKAIRASMEYWNNVIPNEPNDGVEQITEAQISAYLAQPEVAFDMDNWKAKIGVQKWIALYNRGHEAWTEWRRLDYPSLAAPKVIYTSGIPLRFPYPASEQTLNVDAYTAAANAIGGDDAVTRVFWDVD